MAQSQENSGSDDGDIISDGEDGFIPVKSNKKAKKCKTSMQRDIRKVCGCTLGKKRMPFSVKDAATGFTPTVKT